MIEKKSAIFDNVDWRETAGARLYRRAKERIPGGVQLLSKQPERYLPELWPAYYSRARGCEVWDLDGRRFIDMCYSGIGACLLGFADPDVNAAVKQAVDDGSLCTLNTPAEVDLADLLCELHPWADMARYTRAGGEAMAVAVRITRAATGRDRIAVCGYHGWSDWYVAANLSHDGALDGHLMPGLPPSGVPRGLQGTVSTFRYNHLEELEAIVAQGPALAAIVMEPIRFDHPADGFLTGVQAIARRVGAVLVFDEITAGWRHVTGGSHLMLGIEPDMAVFAKSISNGFPMGAVIGRRSVMETAQNSFISSTYWTEAIGPTAALATIKKMRTVRLPDHTAAIGRRLQEGWRRLASRHGLDITVRGLPALTSFSLNYPGKVPALATLLTQLMLERGYIATTTCYPTYAQNNEVVDDYLAALDGAFGILREAVEQDDISARLQGPVALSGFARLT